MAVRYKYQLIQALDDKIGPDLRRVVEGYLGPDREQARSLYIRTSYIVWATLWQFRTASEWLRRQAQVAAWFARSRRTIASRTLRLG